MNPHIWSWPQWIAVGLYVISLLGHATSNGKDMKLKYNFALKLMTTGLGVALLWWGGFFP